MMPHAPKPQDADIAGSQNVGAIDEGKAGASTNFDDTTLDAAETKRLTVATTKRTTMLDEWVGTITLNGRRATSYDREQLGRAMTNEQWSKLKNDLRVFRAMLSTMRNAFYPNIIDALEELKDTCALVDRGEAHQAVSKIQGGGTPACTSLDQGKEELTR